MTGLAGSRVYLDWNATAPLRPVARAAMLRALDAVGNPSSVHKEGRSAWALVERARVQVAALIGCAAEAVVFTSGATEAAALAAAQKSRFGGRFSAPDAAHDCLRVWDDGAAPLPMGADGRLDDALLSEALGPEPRLFARAGANGESGVLDGPCADVAAPDGAPRHVCVADLTQSAGRAPAAAQWRAEACGFAILSSHKLGGPAGAGCLVAAPERALDPLLQGGGQERSRRAGTENVAAIAGFGAAAEAALRDLEDGVWDRVAALRDRLEDRLAAAAPEAVFFGAGAPRLANTSCFAAPGWRGETQVMQMDLAGFAVSAGAACSSGKVEKASRVLTAMGADEETASSAIRVSIGPETTEAEVMAFAEAWETAYARRCARAA